MCATAKFFLLSITVVPLQPQFALLRLCNVTFVCMSEGKKKSELLKRHEMDEIPRVVHM